MNGWLMAAGLVAVGCGGASPHAASTPAAAATPAATPAPSPAILNGVPIGQTGPADLTIRYVERLPTLDYVWDSPRPDVEGWPAPGQRVTWRAHLANWADFALAGVDYTWRLDGQPVASGTIDIDARSEATVDYTSSWEPRRRELELVVDEGHRHTVPRGPFNRLLLHTDALSVGFYVEETIHRLFRQRQHQLRIGSSSFEDWAQLQVHFYNDLLAHAVYPETPAGVRDRLRLDRVTVVPDFALPLVRDVPEGVDPRIIAIFRPNRDDRSVDLQFGFPASVAGDYTDFTSTSTSNGFYYSGYVQHELGHARYLLDTHTLNVHHGLMGQRVEITEGGEPVAGSPYMPGTAIQGPGGAGIRVHRANHRGLMDNEWTFMDRWAAGAWNQIAGHRATRGNYNSPENIGAYVHDLPLENRLTVRDAAGAPLPGAQVRLFQAGGRVFDNAHDLERVADERGQVLLGRNPFSRGESPFDSGVAIVRVQHGGRVGFGFLEIADFNLAFWRGQTELGDHELRVALR